MSDCQENGKGGEGRWETHGLPEGEEDDEFDGDDFEEGSVLGKITVELVEELD